MSASLDARGSSSGSVASRERPSANENPGRPACSSRSPPSPARRPGAASGPGGRETGAGVGAREQDDGLGARALDALAQHGDRPWRGGPRAALGDGEEAPPPALLD